jgi:4,5-DOPA dioxygenase extradiol
MTRLPTLYLGHGAPPLLVDPLWPQQLAAWAGDLPRPKAVLIVSAHWEAAPVALTSIAPAPLVYDFYGFPPEYYRLQYAAPTAPALAQRVRGLLAADTAHQVVQTERGLDHGAYIPLMVMYAQADVPVLQMSLPTSDPDALIALGRRLAPLRDEGVLIVGSGFLTHGLPYVDFSDSAGPAPAWSSEFDAWATEAVQRRDLDALADYRRRAPGLRFAHPTVEHFTPLFVVAGAGDDLSGQIDNPIDGYWFGLAKRSFAFH